MLNTTDILNAAISRQHDDSSELRVKALGWLNEILQLLFIERNWDFLNKLDSVVITADAGPLPDDFGRFLYCRGDDWYLKQMHKLTYEDVDTYASDQIAYPLGFTITGTVIDFYPRVPDTEITLIYSRTIPTYADAEATIVPEKFLPLLSRAILSAIYEYETDQRSQISLQLDQALLNQLRTEENKTKALPKKGKYMRNNL